MNVVSAPNRTTIPTIPQGRQANFRENSSTKEERLDFTVNGSIPWWLFCSLGCRGLTLPLSLSRGLIPTTRDPEPDPGIPSSVRWTASSSGVAPLGWELKQRETVTLWAAIVLFKEPNVCWCGPSEPRHASAVNRSDCQRILIPFVKIIENASA